MLTKRFQFEIAENISKRANHWVCVSMVYTYCVYILFMLLLPFGKSVRGTPIKEAAWAVDLPYSRYHF